MRIEKEKETRDTDRWQQPFIRRYFFLVIIVLKLADADAAIVVVVFFYRKYISIKHTQIR